MFRTAEAPRRRGTVFRLQSSAPPRLCGGRDLAVENYFNYYTEIEERFQQCRGSKTLLSPLDWALIESWKEADLPLAAVLVGIERSFEKFRRRTRKYRLVNSLAYCSQEVYRAAEEARAAEAQGGTRKPADSPAAAPFSTQEVVDFLRRNAEAIEKAGQRAGEAGQHVLAEDLASAGAAVREIAGQEAPQPTGNLEDLETRLTAVEEKLSASLTRASSVELLTELRREVGRGLVPYRRKMSTAQIESLERQFLKKGLLEHYQIPRLSLFYL